MLQAKCLLSKNIISSRQTSFTEKVENIGKQRKKNSIQFKQIIVPNSQVSNYYNCHIKPLGNKRKAQKGRLTY